MESSRCRSCRAEIIWVVLAPKGRPHPVDVQPRSTGTILVTDEVGGQPSAVVLSKTARAQLDEPLYVSHFATCPNAAQHRKSA